MDSVHALSRRIAVALLATTSVVAGVAVVSDSSARAATPNRAAVVVEVDGVIHSAKVSFSGDAITGLDALRDAGFAPSVRVFGANGGAVCALRVGTETIGCPVDGTCLTCGGANYWSYFRAPPGATSYTYSGVGAGSTQVHDGDVEAWAWSSGTPPSPFVSFRDVWGPDPPPSTTTRPTTPPTTARRPPGSTAPPVGPLGSSPVVSTAAPRPASSPTTVAPRPAAPPPTTARHQGSSTTAPVTTSVRAADSGGGAKKIATAPVVAQGGGGSPYGLVGFAVILAALVGAIVVARRRRAGRAPLPT